MADKDEKTEEASAKRRQDTREKGQVAKSNEINSVVVLLAGLGSLFVFKSYLYERVTKMFILVFESIPTVEITPIFLTTHFAIGLLWLLKLLAPILLSILVAGLLINYAQVGILFTLKPIEPKFEKINPAKGLGNIFSAKTVFELVKNIIKLTIIGVVAYYSIKAKMNGIYMLADSSLGNILKAMLTISFNIGMKIALALVVLAIIDWAYQKYKYEESMKMTMQEVKQERKQMDGDPEIKARIKAIQREMSQKRMMADVPEASVVITNPTHVAVALKYDPMSGGAPKVIAKGKSKTAMTIKEIAKEHNIPMVENKPLAWGLVDSVEIGDDIPQELFAPVAEILAYIYKLNNKKVA